MFYQLLSSIFVLKSTIYHQPSKPVYALCSTSYSQLISNFTRLVQCRFQNDMQTLVWRHYEVICNSKPLYWGQTERSLPENGTISVFFVKYYNWTEKTLCHGENCIEWKRYRHSLNALKVKKWRYTPPWQLNMDQFINGIDQVSSLFQNFCEKKHLSLFL